VHACRIGNLEAVMDQLHRSGQCTSLASWAPVWPPKLTPALLHEQSRRDSGWFRFRNRYRRTNDGSSPDQAFPRSRLNERAYLLATSGTRLTGLHEAAEQGHAAVVRVLLHYGADPLARDSSGQIALHKAAARGHEDVVRLLLLQTVGCKAVSYAEVRAQDNGGRTPLHGCLGRLLRVGGGGACCCCQEPMAAGKKSTRPKGAAALSLRVLLICGIAVMSRLSSEVSLCGLTGLTATAYKICVSYGLLPVGRRRQQGH
jgi:hypothetical protein